MLTRHTKKMANGMNLTISPSGVSISFPIGKKGRVTKKANGKTTVSMNLGNGLRYTKTV